MSSAVRDLTDSSFGEEIAGSTLPVLVEFWAHRCPPCRAMAPILDALASDFEERLEVRRINADEHPERARQYEVVAVPTLLIFREGELLRKMTGARSRPRLLAELEDVLS